MNNIKKIVFFITLIFLLIDCNNKLPQDVKKFSTSLIDSGYIPIVKFAIDKNEINFIIDTGSEISIIDDDYYYSHLSNFDNISNIAFSLNTLSGTISSNAIVAATTLDDSLFVQFYITDIDNVKREIFINTGKNIDGIIGCDFLYDKKSIIDFRHKTLSNKEDDATIQY